MTPEDSSKQQAEQSLAEARRNGDRAAEASALTDLGVLALDAGDGACSVRNARDVAASRLGAGRALPSWGLRPKLYDLAASRPAGR